MEFVEYVYAVTEGGGVEEIGRLFTDGLTTFLVPIGWTFPEAFDTTVQSMIDATSEAVYAVTEYIGISGGE
jgi:hypothetical protein